MPMAFVRDKMSQEPDNTKNQAEERGIVIVDDTPENLRLLVGILKEQGYKVRPAASALRALATIDKEPPDLILLDIMMPEMDGFEVCRRLKASPRTRDIPVVFLSALNDTSEKLKAFQGGGVDFISKPFQVEEVLARVNTHLVIRAQQQTLMRQNEELREKNDLITRQARQLELIATRDCLTEIANRRHFLERLAEETKRFQRNSRNFALILLDIDHFKTINDSFGHECGDLILKEVARTLEKFLREQDLVARWGGEEFICLLPDTETAGARSVAEKMRRGVEEQEHCCDGRRVRVSITLGGSVYDGSASPEECIRRADEAMYEGKRQGRNRVVVAGEGRP
jgi:diguanylate cyclase (GGDEF)-like protein